MTEEDKNKPNQLKNVSPKSDLAERVRQSLEKNKQQIKPQMQGAKGNKMVPEKLAQKNWFQKAVTIANGALTKMDSFIGFMSNRQIKNQHQDEVVQNARSPIVFGTWVIIICFGFFGIWASLAPINQASIAGGTIVVDSNRKTIQHKEGGVIKEILVKEGDLVKERDILIKLSDTSASANLEILTSRLYSLKANEDRLMAERDEANELKFRPEIVEKMDDPEILKIISSQNRIFESRLSIVKSKKEITQKKINQLQRQIEGINAQKYSAGIQLNKIKEQVDSVTKLLAKGNAQRSRLLDLESRQAAISGQIGEYISKIATANQQIASTEIELMHDRSDMLNKIEQELKDTQNQLIEVQEKIGDARDIMERTEIRSPIGGTINNMSYHTIGGVIPPNGAILEIIPNDDKLVIEARVKPEDIDIVNVGQEAFANLNAYRARFVPPVKGKVVHLSADIISDPNAANPEERSFYKAKIEIDKKQFEDDPKLKDIELYPGMPASILIVVGSRTFMRYLLDPILNTMRLSFREE